MFCGIIWYSCVYKGADAIKLRGALQDLLKSLIHFERELLFNNSQIICISHSNSYYQE